MAPLACFSTCRNKTGLYFNPGKSAVDRLDFMKKKSALEYYKGDSVVLFITQTDIHGDNIMLTRKLVSIAA